jgi:hypothetical protein
MAGPNWTQKFALFAVLLIVTWRGSTAEARDVRPENQLLFDERGSQLDTSRPAAAEPSEKTTRPAAGSKAGVVRPSNAAGAPNASRARNRQTPGAPEQSFGRVPVQDFSVGLETNKKLKADQLPDGGKMPGVESMRRDTNDLPFIGLSVTVPH